VETHPVLGLGGWGKRERGRGGGTVWHQGEKQLVPKKKKRPRCVQERLGEKKPLERGVQRKVKKNTKRKKVGCGAREKQFEGDKKKADKNLTAKEEKKQK